MDIKIKDSAKGITVGHNDIGKTLGEHTEPELILLGIEARRANNPLLIGYFETLPLLSEMVGNKVDTALQEINAEKKETSVSPTPAATATPAAAPQVSVKPAETSNTSNTNATPAKPSNN